MSPALRITTAVIGIILLLAAAVLAFVVVPGQAQLPADTNAVRNYSGQVDTLLDSEALARVDLDNVLLHDLPITIEQTVEVTGVADEVAEVSDSATISLPDGSVLLETDDAFQVDRKTMFAQGDAQGLVIGWPIGPDEADTEGWSGPLQTTVPYVFDGTEEHAGIETLRFTGTESGRIVDEAWLATVPATVPAGLLGILASALDVPDAALAQLEEVRADLPPEVPLGYLIDATTTFYVHPGTGQVIDVDIAEARSVVLDVPGFDTTPLAPVLDLNYQGDPDSVARVIAEADDSAGQLALLGTTVPLVLGVLGIVLLVAALLLGRSSRSSRVDA